MSNERLTNIDGKSGLALSETVAEKAQWLGIWAIILKDELLKVVPNTGYEAIAVPKVVMEKMNIRVPGMLGSELDENGINRAVIMNTEYLSLPDRVIAEILLHQLVHHWQQTEGKRPSRVNGHNKQFVEVSEEMGVHVTQVTGNHHRPPNGRFVDLMYEHKLKPIEPPELPEDVGINDWWNYLPGQEDGINRKGESGLTKWTCGCQIVRVGTEDFYATCSKCHNDFHPVSKK